MGAIKYIPDLGYAFQDELTSEWVLMNERGRFALGADPRLFIEAWRSRKFRGRVASCFHSIIITAPGVTDIQGYNLERGERLHIDSIGQTQQVASAIGPTTYDENGLWSSVIWLEWKAITVPGSKISGMGNWGVMFPTKVDMDFEGPGLMLFRNKWTGAVPNGAMNFELNGVIDYD
jgi:hypothetical protein